VPGDPLQADHIVSVADGGGDELANLRAIHRSEHRRRTGQQGAEAAKRKASEHAWSQQEGAADPGVRTCRQLQDREGRPRRREIPWSEVESGHWQADCQCRSEHVYDRSADPRARLDRRDPSTFRHAGQCEHRGTTDPVVLRAISKVRDGAGGDYWWVECGACDTAWQVPHYAAESVG
jgi:HNH endonuclease